jgi:mRNA-degrading endonuclease RelE of RelBE toxin-antitoxin system
MIKSLHSDLKPVLKNEIESLRKNPYLGKPLIEELAGFYSLRFRRYRVIYKVETGKNMVEIHYVGHRRDIYQEFRKLLQKNQ